MGSPVANLRRSRAQCACAPQSEIAVSEIAVCQAARQGRPTGKGLAASGGSCKAPNQSCIIDLSIHPLGCGFASRICLRLDSPRGIRLTRVFCSSRVLGADMRCELFVALLFVVRLHLFNGVANNRPRRLERPRAFLACPALKILCFHPYQLATHRLHGTPRIGALRFCEKGYGIGLGRHCGDKPPSFHCFERGSATVAAVRPHSKTEVNRQGLNSSDRKRLLSVGYPTQARIAISIPDHPQTVE